MDIDEIKLRIKELIYEYKKQNEYNLYYNNIKDLKWVLNMLEEL